MTIDQLRETNNGTLPPYAWPGGYQIIYYTDGLTICPTCANKPGIDVNAWEVYWEGPEILCEDCQKPIQSAYGDPEET